MNFKNWMGKYRYLGQCDRLRMCGDEESWQTMMAQKQPISKEEFETRCDLSQLLEDDETLDDFIAGDPDAAFYKSVWGDKPAYFIQTAGFEFIFTSN